MIFSPKDHTWALCAYGKSPYLEECIRSLQAQAEPSRIILCTGTPSAWLEEIAGKYSLSLFVHEGGQGIGADWNAAYDQAETPLVTIAHQDDLYEPEYTREMLKELNRSKDPILFFSDYEELRNAKRIHDNRNLTIKRLLLWPLKGRLFRNNRFVRRRILSFGSPICCPSVTYVKAQTGDTIFSTEMKVSLDWDQWEKQSRKHGAFVYCPKVLMLHRVHEASETTKLIGDHTRTKEDREMFRRFWPEPVAGIIARRYAESEKSNAT